MKKILSYHNSEELKQASVAAAIRHMKEDSIVSGTYGEMNGKFRGCSVGCDAYDIKGCIVDDDDCHAITAEHFGFPTWLEYMRDAIFEGLPAQSRNNFHIEIKKAIPVGIDLEPVLRMFAIRRVDALTPLGENCGRSFGTVYSAELAEWYEQERRTLIEILFSLS